MKVICGCGSMAEAVETAKKAVEAAFLDKGEDGMCLMYQLVVSQAITALCLRGLNMQLKDILTKEGKEKSTEERRNAVMNVADQLQKQLCSHLSGNGDKLDEFIVAMLAKKEGENPFSLHEEEESTGGHSVH